MTIIKHLILALFMLYAAYSFKVDEEPVESSTTVSNSIFKYNNK